MAKNDKDDKEDKDDKDDKDDKEDKDDKDDKDDAVFCTADVFECPDGSFVARDPANDCAFSPCPEDEMDVDGSDTMDAMLPPSNNTTGR